MSKKPLYLNILWHMHQPFYKNPLTQTYELPWVRLHGTKDYYDMVSILNDFPDIHQTFNLVPSLIEQINDYAVGKGSDHFLNLAVKDPAEFTEEEKIEVAKYFFMANYDTMILPFRRYRELFEKRGHHPSDESLKWVNYSYQEMFDLQVWFNLAWFDPIFRDKNSIVDHLIRKDRNFTEKDKTQLLEFQKQVMGMIIPEYKKLSEKGTVELTTTPYYHPIMPLVYDSDIAKVGMPGVNLPKQRFSYPEDVKKQVKKAIALHKSVFGINPKGMWPSEGSVSEAILPILAENGIKWIATDEEVLRESLNFSQDSSARVPGALYKPYSLKRGSHEMSIVFRDHVLSDLLGFVYSKWDPIDAANNFISRLHAIRDHLYKYDDNFLVSVILDGENAWEYYRNDGQDFLVALYERLSQDKFIESVTVSEFLAMDNNLPKITKLFPGSWINHNFGIWIGHDEDNKAWDFLHETRNALVEHEAENPDDKNIPAAWEEIYIAEGSDWNWWYGDDHSSGIDELFDRLYRTHLANVYTLIGKAVPDWLLVSILTSKRKRITPKVEPVYSITPIIDGRNSNYFEWISAGIYEFSAQGDAMHQVTKIISKLYYGFDENNIYFRIDTDQPIIPLEKTTYNIEILFVAPIELVVNISINDKGIAEAKYRKKKNKKYTKLKEVAVDDIAEIAIPRNLVLGETSSKGGNIEIFLKFYENKIEMEKIPKSQPLVIYVSEIGADDLRWLV